MKKVLYLLISNFSLAIVFANKALAQEAFGINDLGDAGVSLGSKPIQETIAGIVNIFLGFLGILATLLILYAGFLWMTSRGNAEKIERAKLLIISAVIGLVIIVSAYAISRFILSRLYETTGPTGPGGGPGPGPGGPAICNEPADLDAPLVCALSRTTGPVGSGLTISGWHFDTDGDGTTGIGVPGPGRVEIGGIAAEIVECAGTQMWSDRKVKVKIPDALVPGNYPVVLFNDLDNESIELLHFDFTVTEGISSVNIDCLVPDNEASTVLQTPPPTIVKILGNGFTDIQDTVSMNAWIAGAETSINLNVINWSDLEINAEIPAEALASNVIVSVAGNTDQEFFNVTCGVNADCPSNCCALSSNSCVSVDICNGAVIIPGANAPVIQSISPDDGAGNTLITIFGYNFGADADLANPNVADRGSVTFNGVEGIWPSTLNAACTPDVWTDKYIIIGVPPGLDELLDIDVTKALVYGGETSEDAYSGFTRDALKTRPGICSLDAVEGSYGDMLGIEGLNFANGDNAYFDTVASYITNVTPPNSVTSQVPNVVGNLNVTMQSLLSGNSSNPFPFSALAISGGNPVITELSPDNGPVDSYVTVRGSNFGNNVGRVLFDPNPLVVGDEVSGGFDFPTQCGDYWFDDHIIIKVPAGPWVIGNQYPIRVERNGDLALSNDFDFTINNNPLGPQICALVPDNGPIGEPIRIFGENLGSVAGDVTFYNSVPTTYDVWNANQVLNADVPLGASTGPVVVTDSAGNNSNGIAFEVGACANASQCGVGEQCCTGTVGNYCAAICEIVLNSALYSWEVSTQAEPFGLVYNYSCVSGLQSPTPWPDQHEWTNPATGFPENPASLDAFVDANISALFTRNVEDADFNNINIRLHQCTDDTCTAYAGDVAGVIDIINHNTDREGFSFNPNVDLLGDTWYEVELGTFNAEIGADSWIPDPVLDEWTFKTRDAALLCEVTGVAVTPQSPQANVYPGKNKNFNASPLANNCNICGGTYDWNWQVVDPLPAGNYASIAPLINMSVNKGVTVLTGGTDSTENLAIPNNHVTLIAENTNYGVSGESYPVILAPLLRVEDSQPTCSDSCLNVAVWVDFNTVLTAPLNIADFAIYRCLDASCSGWDTGTSYTNNLATSILADGTYRVNLLHNLVPNENYKVIIDGSITNVHGYPLGTDYTWNFGVSDQNCMITGVDILPDNYTAYSLNNISYQGYATAETGSCGTQAIQCESCNWNWSTDNPGIATIATGANTVLATPLINGNTNVNLNIDGTALVPSLGSASGSTPLTISIDGPGITELAVDNYWPNCNGACANSEVQILFNSVILPATVNTTNFRIFDETDGGADETIGVTLDTETLVTLQHVDFQLDHTYRVEINDQVRNEDNDNIAGGFSWTFTVSQADCLASGIVVQPQNAIAGALDIVPYFAQATGDICGNAPVTCASCTYSWHDVPGIGTFGSAATQSTPFNTLATATNGDYNITLDAFDDGNPLPVDDGTLTIDLNITPPDPLSIVDYWPVCDGACDNSQVGVSFNTTINGATLGGSIITDITDPLNLIPVTSGLTLATDTTLIIEHDPFVLGHTYRVELSPTIENIDGSVLGVTPPWEFTVGEADCQIVSVSVMPNSTIAGANQGVPYIVQTEANTVSCGNLPVYCATCTYNWTYLPLPPPNLGGFNNANIQSPIFTTAGNPPIMNGDVITVNAQVNDQGAIFNSSGDINISIGAPLIPTVDLIEAFPKDLVNMCVNILPYFEFDTSNGDLDRNSLIDHAVFNNWVTSTTVDFSLRFVSLDPLNPQILTALFEPNNVLDINSIYFFGVDDIDAVVAEGGVPIQDLVPLSSYPPTYAGAFFHTGPNACPLHSVEVIPQNDLFTCKDNNCDGDTSAVNGNQHTYQAIAYDIQKNILSSALNTYTWASVDSSIVSPELPINSSSVLATAGDNGITNMTVQAFPNVDPANVVFDSNTAEVATCQSPWPSLATYPWNPNDAPDPDMNFSTYYCQAYGILGETPLPVMNIPQINISPNPNVIREYISFIDYPIALNSPSPYLGSLAYNDNEEDNSIGSRIKKFVSLFKISKTHSQALIRPDIISVRVMSNPKHLSVLDWYNEDAPNPVDAGSLIQVDGYEALQVGASIYVASANMEGGSIYTNIYIIAHNIGANATTLDIYNQLVDNFKLNINVNTPATNTCRLQANLSCSNDFDCPSFCTNPAFSTQADCVAPATWQGDTCDSSLLKMRRDVKRLGDLVSINKAILNYGANHKACVNNSLISCEADTDCPSGAACVSYFPPLNAGSYLDGASNSRWPSWQETLRNTLSVPLADDPINLFNGCESEVAASGSYDPNTCWNEQTLQFICPANSLVYMYNIEVIGQGYYLGANFEYDMQNPITTNFINNLIPSVNAYLDLDINDPYCNFIPVDAPGASASPYCGNGMINTNYCTNQIYDNQGDCNLAGEKWIVAEECDSQFHKFACSQEPPGIQAVNGPFPIVPPGAGTEWWNEQTVGCNPPGAINSAGDLIECTWYRPQPALVAKQCGGYCGDGTRQAYYESCDGSVPAIGYVCVDGNPADLSCDNCQVICNDSAGTYPAALCGDGIWSQGTEQCDPSATPDGNAGWDCTEGGAIGCSNSCQHTCTVGEPYAGICGDGIVATEINPISGQAYEACDYANYVSVLPVNSGASSSYGCTSSCTMNNAFCGDGITQYQYQELCDYNGAYSTPEPLFSDEFHQYACRDSGTYTALNTLAYGACTPTLGGYCGDGNIQDGVLFSDYGEECDPGSPWDGIFQSCPVGECLGTSANNQYLCDVDCVGTTGGYCGDNKADTKKDPVTNLSYEICDGTDYPGRPIPAQSNAGNTYACANDCNSSAVGGGYCGDGIKNVNYYEACDWGNPEDTSNWPWPRGSNINKFSSEMNQYVCSGCVNYGGYCGNGIVDGNCTTACSNCEPDGTNCTSSINCTEFQCTSHGGIFTPYEQCDNGYDPAYLVDKDIDIVYIFDTSGSLSTAADNLCEATATVVNTLAAYPDVDYRITIMPLGDGDMYNGGAELTATLDDNSREFFWLEKQPPPLGDGTFNATVNYDIVFDELYTNCLATSGGLVEDPVNNITIDPRVRYISPYDDATNDINGHVEIRAGDMVNEFCAAFDATENWGYVMKRVIEDYNWLDGYHRIVVPVSDEPAVCGNPYNTNEDYVTLDGVYDILAEAVKAATINPSNPVYISPVLLGGGLNTVGALMADATGGSFTNTTNNWAAQTVQVINSTICDGAGGGPAGDEPDGHMDCKMDSAWVPIPPPPPAPPVITSALATSILQGNPFSYTIVASNNPVSFGASSLPAGLTINTGTGLISGTPTVGPGSYPIDISATNAGGTDIETLSLSINPPPPVITSLLNYSILNGSNFSYIIQATNSPSSFNATGLPAGLFINTASGLISGKPTSGVGTYNITISASNISGTDTRILVLTINPCSAVGSSCAALPCCPGPGISCNASATCIYIPPVAW